MSVIRLVSLSLGLFVSSAWAGPPASNGTPSGLPTEALTPAPDGPKTDEAGKEAHIDVLDPDAPVDLAVRLRVFRQARARRAEVIKLEAVLARRVARLEAVQADLEVRYKALGLIQEELSVLTADESQDNAEDALAARAAEDAERERKVRKLSKVFGKMKPDEAAKVVKAMDEKLVVRVLSRIKARQAAKILGQVEPGRAARISEKMAKVKKSRTGKGASRP